ncbi:MAG: hypothetical protein QM784_35170 [Polyangiaceae bacterium]
MSSNRVFPLESIRTDGWFERIGEGIGSFQTLCEVIGPKFFAFAMIAGARIVALTIRSPQSGQHARRFPRLPATSPSWWRRRPSD